MACVSEYIDKYLDRSEGKKRYNCAEATFLAANEAWNLGSEDMVKMLFGFGGGFNAGIVCGAISGGTSALTLKYYGDVRLKAKVRLFVETVRQRLDSENCSVLKERYFDKENFCDKTIRLIAQILDDVDAMDTESEKQTDCEGKVKIK